MCCEELFSLAESTPPKLCQSTSLSFASDASGNNSSQHAPLSLWKWGVAVATRSPTAHGRRADGDLVRAARKGLGDGYLVNAGSVNTKEQITEMKAAGCDAFTIGSAAFDGSFSPLKGLLRSQLKDILEVDR